MLIIWVLRKSQPDISWSALMFMAAVCLLVTPLWASAGEVVANQIQRDTYGMIHAEGDVQVRTQDFVIQAQKVRLDVDAKAGEMQDASIAFPDDEKLSGTYLQRIDLETFYGENIIYTYCPEDEWAWSIMAESATLDQDAGVFEASHAKFVWGGIPVLYTPYWTHALTRRSGLLMPTMANSTRRGFEFTLPYYWAAAPNWDMTFAPRWMTLRGLMAEVDWRHRSYIGSEQVFLQALKDKQTGEQRGRLQTDMRWQFTPSWNAILDIDAASDGLYVADFPLAGDKNTTAYLTSTAAVTWQDGSDRAVLSSRYQQLLGGASNAATLQILPRLQTRHYFDVADEQRIKLEHQTTMFKRDSGVSGLRTGLRPSWTLPWQMQGGAVSIDWSVLGQYVGYDSEQFTQASSSYAALASSLQMQAVFERIFADNQWRHEIKPIIRLDVSATPDQDEQPRYDSSLLPLSLSNILQGNRYSGWDRFERMRRVSVVVASSLQTKANQRSVRTVLQGQVGMVWDDLQESVDTNITPVPTRTVSNILAELAWMPSVGWKTSIGGQHDPDSNRWVESHAGLTWSGQQGQYFNMTWQRSEASHSRDAEALSAAGKVQWNSRWSSHVTSQYDLLRERMIKASAGVAYSHACWDFSLEGFKTFQVGTDSLTDIGWRFLLAFEGLGSFGG